MQGLSEACESLGYPIPRSTLTNLELGRKESVVLQELAVIAAALDVPPVLLAFPTQMEERIEVLPNAYATTLGAIRWFTGEAPLFATRPTDYHGLDSDKAVIEEWVGDPSGKRWQVAGRPLMLARKMEQLRGDADRAVAHVHRAIEDRTQHPDDPARQHVVDMLTHRLVALRDELAEVEQELREAESGTEEGGTGDAQTTD